MKKLPRLLRDAIAIGVITCPALGAGLNLADWKNLQELEIRHPGTVRVSLPPATLDAAESDYRDLRLLDPAGQEQSYLIENVRATAREQRPVAKFDARMVDQKTQITVAVGTQAPLDAIELETPHRHFIKAARVEISTAAGKWEEIADGLPLFRQSGSEQLEIKLGHRRAAQVRVTIDDSRSPPVPFPRATLRVARSTPAAEMPMNATISRREEFAGETVLTLALAARHVPLAKLAFVTPEGIFTRRVTVGVRELRDGIAEERTIALGTIYRLAVDGSEVREQLELPLNVTTPGRELLVHIQNGDAPPLELTSAQLYRRPATLVFHANRIGTHRLLSGNANARAPSYDLGGFARELRRTSIPMISPGPLEANPSFAQSDALAGIPLLGATMDVDGWKYRRAVQFGNRPVQELELDLGVLAGARHDFGDLRVVQNGRQVPYLLEQTKHHRELTLAIQADDDPERPKVSRWKLILPRQNLPLHRLTLESPSALFERQIRVFEMVQTTRGDSFEQAVATAPWRNLLNSEDDNTLSIVLDDVAQSEALWLETDNGDNPAIMISSATVTYPVVRLLFKPAEASPVTLHYGNLNVGAPQYDLGLVAPQLLSAERAPATLGVEAANDGMLVRGTLRGLRGGPIFWISLAAVVIVLLVVVAKHLPKPEEPAG